MRGYCRSLQHSASGPPCLAAEIRGASAGTRGKLRGLQGPSADGRGDGARPSGEQAMHGHLLVWSEQRSPWAEAFARARGHFHPPAHTNQWKCVLSSPAHPPSVIPVLKRLSILYTHTHKSLTFQTENKQDNTDRESRAQEGRPGGHTLRGPYYLLGPLIDPCEVRKALAEVPGRFLL